MSNPLDLAGPQFLTFYALTAVITLGLLFVVRSAGETGDPPRIDTSDPYLIAYLRGGANEALRVATVTLIDRGVLEANPSARTVTTRLKETGVRRPIEQALVRHFEQSHAAITVFGHPALVAACEEYERRLTTLGLLPDAARRRARRAWLGLALLLLVGLSVAKLVVAFSRGRSNVGFLLVLTIVASLVAVKVATPRLTTRGRALLADLRRLFARLRERAPRLVSGGASADAALLAAVFGLGTLPHADFAYARMLYPRSSSTISSSCGSLCGSSCGGGGNGGGCGGCGGGGGGGGD